MADNKLRPITVRAHERPVTCVKYNSDADLFFTTGKDYIATVYYSSNAERLGVFKGHRGAIYDVDSNYDSTLLVTGSGDKTARIWDLLTGVTLHALAIGAGVRCVRFSNGHEMLALATDSHSARDEKGDKLNGTPQILLFNLTDIEEAHKEWKESKLPGPDKQHPEAFAVDPVRTLDVPCGVASLQWSNLNEQIIVGCKDGTVKKWDVTENEVSKTIEAHKQVAAGSFSVQLQDLQLSRDGSMFITASNDGTAKLWDFATMEHLKTYKADRNLNSAAISPLMNHIIVAGGQDAKDVTTTSAGAGGFEIDFFDLVTESFLGQVKGHFGPVHSVSFAPDGKSFMSGSEDGYARINHFPPSYFDPKDLQVGASFGAPLANRAPISRQQSDKEKEKEISEPEKPEGKGKSDKGADGSAASKKADKSADGAAPKKADKSAAVAADASAAPKKKAKKKK